jgi:hypothetical protein
VQRYSAAGAAGFNVAIPGAGLHAAALLGDGTVLAAGEMGGQMLLARITDAGAVTRLSQMNAGAGANTGQAIAVQPDGRVFVGGGANAGSRTALAIVRFAADGSVDGTFGVGGQITTPLGTHDAYLTGLALDGARVAASGRARTTAAPGHLFSVAVRYHAVGGPPVPGSTPPVVPGTPVTTPVVAAPIALGTKPVTTVTNTVIKKAKSCIVPKVRGRKLKKARKMVLAGGCKLRVRYVISKKARNTVLAQSRKAGKKLGFRSVVKLTIAKPKKV